MTGGGVGVGVGVGGVSLRSALGVDFVAEPVRLVTARGEVVEDVSAGPEPAFVGAVGESHADPVTPTTIDAARQKPTFL